MPTEEERKRKEYRNGYDPRGPLPGKWDAARAEINSLRGGPSEWGSAAQVERGVNYVKSIPERLNEYGEQALNKAREESMGPAARERRLEMANYPSEASRSPNMPQAAPEMPVMRDSESEAQRLPAYRQPEPAAVANGSDVPTRESSRSASSASVGVAGAGRGGTGPTISAGDQEYLNRQPVTADPRKRYFDMAQMSLEQREQYLNSLPEGQRPIQTIRGNKEGWYSPGMSKEFATIPEAMSGVEGRPTMKSEMNREEEARDRAAMVDMAGANIRARLAAEDKRQAGSDRRHVAEGAGKAHDWKVEEFEVPDASGTMTKKKMFWNPRNPTEHFEMVPDAAPAIAGKMLEDMNRDESSVKKWATTLNSFDREMKKATLEKFPKERRDLIRKALEEEEKSKNKK